MIYIGSKITIWYESNNRGGERMVKKWLCVEHFEQHKKAYKPNKKGIWENIRVCSDEGKAFTCFECRVLARVNNACAKIGF